MDAGLEGYNLFLYCANDPVGRIDISGTDSEKVANLDLDDDDAHEYGGGGSGSGTGSMIGDISYISNKDAGPWNCVSSIWQWLCSKLGLNQANNSNKQQSNITPQSQSAVPQEAKDTLSYVDQTGRAPQGYKGGKVFQNDGRNGSYVLPSSGMPYHEYDIYPHVRGMSRGLERLVIGADGSAWYTADHYKTFIALR